MRPTSSQIDLWPSLGLKLDWNRLFAFSKYGEHFQPPSRNLTALGGSYEAFAHGFDGPLSTSISSHMETGDIHEIFNITFQKLGIPPLHEFNGGELRGYGVQIMTQRGIADVRDDVARAYYYPAEDRQNLIVMINTTGTRILWAQDSSNGNAIASELRSSARMGKSLRYMQIAKLFSQQV